MTDGCIRMQICLLTVALGGILKSDWSEIVDSFSITATLTIMAAGQITGLYQCVHSNTL